MKGRAWEDSPRAVPTDAAAEINGAMRTLELLPSTTAGNMIYIDHAGESDGIVWKTAEAYHPRNSHRKESVLSVGKTEVVGLESIPARSLSYGIYDLMMEYGYTDRADVSIVATSIYKYRKRNSMTRRTYEVSSHLLLGDGGASRELGHFVADETMLQKNGLKMNVREAEEIFGMMDELDVERVKQAVARLMSSVLQ